jgi:cell fate regulator YaaT (PSP1 superfamily)
MSNQFDSTIENNNEGYYVGVRFNTTGKSYYFSTYDPDLNLGTPVVVETVRGYELGHVQIPPLSLASYDHHLDLKPILRIANENDIQNHQRNQKDAVIAMGYCAQEIENLNLKMNLVSAEYTLDRAKLIFSYLADERVDFRELLRVLASRFHTRIDLRQIGSRDKAKMIGGIGVCGLPLCCATFLNEFDNISINRAKNQLLTLNIPKLSGHCGKLICCLKYEDDAYSELRETFPRLGQKVKYNDDIFRISSMNVLSRMIKIENRETVHFLPLEEVNKLPKVANEKR